MSQLDLFGRVPPPSAKPRRVKLPAPALCVRHAEGCICPDCPGELQTDAYGFVHPSLCRGLVRVRVCPACHMPVTRENWIPFTATCSHEGCVEARGAR